MKNFGFVLFICSIVFIFSASLSHAANLDFSDGTLNGWQADGIWQVVSKDKWEGSYAGSSNYVVVSNGKGEQGTGTLKSKPFTINKETLEFYIAGADGTEQNQNDNKLNYVRLRSADDNSILREAHTPNNHIHFNKVTWFVNDLNGREVYLEITDGNPGYHKGGWAWIGAADLKQLDRKIEGTTLKKNLYGLKMDDGAEFVTCRSVPFLGCLPENRSSLRIADANKEVIPVGSKADSLYILGMINEGWDFGVAHWGEHPELRKIRDDQIYIGSQIGELEIVYEDGKTDKIPITIGATAWFFAQWAYGPTHGVTVPVQEPFASRPECMKVFRECLKLHEGDTSGDGSQRFRRYYLAVKPQKKIIKQIIVHDNTKLRGRPLVAGITLENASNTENLKPFGSWKVAEADIANPLHSSAKNDFSKEISKLSRLLYTRDEDLPEKFEILDFPKNLDVAKIRFKGGKLADMLWNIWVQNMMSLDEKFEPDTGFFYESGVKYPWYGGYQGIGTWAGLGIYRGTAFGRSSDHFGTLTMRCLNNSQRWQNYVEFCDKHLYFYRSNHDPNKGPENSALDITKYPADAPPHWGFGVNTGPCMTFPINEIFGDEETDGHGSTAVGRWVAWRLLGAPNGDWLLAPRDKIYGKSRYDSTHDAAEFICWLMDYTAKDVMWCEGESTGWAGPLSYKSFPVRDYRLVPKGMADTTDPDEIKKNYANSNHMYQPYPTYICMTALRCSAQMADAAGKSEDAARWRKYADRLQAGMLRELFVGDLSNRMWRVSPYCVYPSLQESLVQAFSSIYLEGLDSERWHPEMAEITRNTLKRHLNQQYGHAPVLGMGYGIGWLMHSALVLDHMDDASKLTENFVKYVYDKNMDYVDKTRGIDWRRWMWLIPEGTNILPDGSWYRIGDLTNGANQGPPLHAMELCAGIDDSKPEDLKIMPRIPDPMTGIEIKDFLVLVPQGRQLEIARVNYSYDKNSAKFSLTSSKTLPTLSIRIGPFSEQKVQNVSDALKKKLSANIRPEKSGSYRQKEAWWVWIEGLKDIQKIDF